MKKHYNETFAQADVLKNLSKKLNRGLFAATLLSVGLGFVVTKEMMESFNSSSAEEEVTDPVYKEAPGSKDRAPRSKKDAPKVRKNAPGSKRGKPGATKDAPVAPSKKPSSKKK